MIFSLKKLILSLIDIIIGSPTSILFIILGIIFSVAMIINIKKNKTIGKTLYMIGWIFIITFIIVKYNNYISKIFDNLINTIFMQIFFPNLATYTIIIIITNIIFLHTVFNKKTNTSDKLINSPFFIIIMVLMVYTIELVSKNNINVYQRKEVYSNDTVITIIESTTLIFTLWIIIILSKFILKKLIKKSDNKIIKEYELKNKEANNITNQETPIIQTNNINQEQIIPQIIPNPINEDKVQTNNINQEQPMPQIIPNPINEEDIQTNNINQEHPMPQIIPNPINEEYIQTNNINQEQIMPQIIPNPINEKDIQTNNMNQEQIIPQPIENQMPIIQPPTINTESEIVKTFENAITNQPINEQNNKIEQSIDKEIQNNPDIFDSLPSVTQTDDNENTTSMTLPKKEDIEVLKI